MDGFRRFDLNRLRRGGACRTSAWLAIATFAVFLTMAPGAALAQGIFDFLFGQRPPAPPPSPLPSVQPQANQNTDPLGHIRPNESITNSNTGRVVAYCVRLCDGRYFPLEHRTAVQAVQLCSAFCPASPTKVFNGSVIDAASAADGARYVDLKTAYLYRKKVVDNCTCNGKDAFGLAAIDLDRDPTLRPGDTVTTTDGTEKVDVLRAPSARGAVDAPSPDPSRLPGSRGGSGPARPN